MKVLEVILEDNEHSGIKIYVDGERKCFFVDGELEDATISRDYNDVYVITDLMLLAFQAADKDEVFEHTVLNVNREEFRSYGARL